MEERENEVLRLTSQSLRDQCSRQFGQLKGLLADDVVWIGPMDFQWAESKAEMDAILEKSQRKKELEIREERYRVLGSDKDSCVVYGSLLCGQWAGENIICYKIRATFLWKRIKGKWRVKHMHISQPYDYPLSSDTAYTERDDIFEYAGRFADKRRQWNEEDRGRQKLLIKDCSGYYHYVYDGEILCVESERHNCNVILKNRTIQVRKKISEFESELPGSFWRVHRGYLVNRNVVSGIAPYRLRLLNGMEVPVSRDKYARIRELLKKRTGHTGTESGGMTHS